MKAIILAAGCGSRLGSLTNKTPKALINVASIPLVIRAINFSKKIDINEVIVIGGYKFGLLNESLKNENINLIENINFNKGNLYTIACAKKFLTNDFIVLNIDHLYPTHLARMINEVNEGIWAVSDFDRPLFQDDMKVKISGDLINGMTLESISKELDYFDGGYCGVTIVKGKTSINKYNEALDYVLEHGMEQAVVEGVLEKLIHLNFAPKILDISGIRWLEIDTQEDLANAERILKMKPHFLD